MYPLQILLFSSYCIIRNRILLCYNLNKKYYVYSSFVIFTSWGTGLKQETPDRYYSAEALVCFVGFTGYKTTVSLFLYLLISFNASLYSLVSLPCDQFATSSFL